MSKTPTWRPGRRAAISLLLCLSGVALPACAPPAMRLSFNVDPDANNNSPVSISVIVAYEAPVVEKLLGLRLDEPLALNGEERLLDPAALARLAELGLVESHEDELSLTWRGCLLGGGVTAELRA